MPWRRSIRYVARWVLGVFLLAQLSGLAPGHYEHAGAARGHTIMHAPSVGSGGSHHHVLGHSDDECCAVHAMPIVPAGVDVVSPGFAMAHKLPSAERTLAPTGFAPADPPPRLLMSV